jgi:formylglycine-generating enzyme required for sulfatase activity
VANELGIYDMSGNVWEWCSDYGVGYYPSDTNNPIGAVSGSSRVFRGGSWYCDTFCSGVSHRYNFMPQFRGFNVGFRLAFDDVTFDMVSVPGGTTILNSQTVTLSTFSIGKHEVTQELWEAVMGTTYPGTAPYPANGKGVDYPVYYISWEDIVGTSGNGSAEGYTLKGVIYYTNGFCYKLSQLIGGGKQFRLPTEAEWEYAAKGGQQTHNYNYSGSGTIGNVAWYNVNSGNISHVVGTKAANELGIYDMTGNVWEWCSDWYGDTYPYPSPYQDPTGAEWGTMHVDRGGSWNYGASDCRVTVRTHTTPSHQYNYLGFRLAL